MQARTYFPKVRRMLLCFLSFNFNTLLASFHAASQAPCSYHSVSSWDRSSNFGALGLRWWGWPGQINPSEGFWFRILLWRAIAFVNFTRWIGFCMSELFRKIDEDSAAPHPGIRNPIVVYLMSKHSQQVAPFYRTTHTSSTWPLHFCHHFFGSFTRLFINLTMCIRTLFSKSATTRGLVEQAFWRVSLFTEWIGASSFEVILAGPSRLSTTGTLSSGTSGSRRISLILLHERTRRRIRLCQFRTLINIVTGTAIVSFRTLPVGFPLPTISKNSLYTLFCSLILDHGVLLKNSISGPKVLISNILLDTSLHHRLQSVIIRSCFLLMSLQVIQFQHGLEFPRLSYS